jgi:hypothetical protein
MAEKASQQIWPTLYGESCAPRPVCEVVKIDGGIVGERIGFEPSPQVFDGIELRGVRRQVFQMCRAGQNAFVDEFALVGLEAVPDQHDGHFQLPLQMLKEIHCEFGVDVGGRVQAKVQSDPIACRRNAQRGDGADLLIVLAPLPKHRGVPAQTPGTAHQGSHEHAGFVEKNDGCIQPRGVFFTRGQSCSIQAWIRSSSRSRARRVGFCGEKPNPCRTRLTCAG